MRSLFIALLAGSLLLTSCSTLKHIEGYELLGGIDLRPYAEKGFLITPGDYGGEYISIYLVNYIVMPEARYEGSEKGRDGTQTTTWVKDVIDLDAALDGIYQKCVSMGSDALIDFNIGFSSESYTGITNPTTVTGYKITGIAIKRVE